MEACTQPANPVLPKYYGVVIPRNTLVASPGSIDKVYLSQVDALKVIKAYPGSRFKCFNNREDALVFANTELVTEAKPCDSTENLAIALERPLYSSVKMQDLVVLRKAIEVDDSERVRALIRSNPRYLVSSGDTPTVLQEGSRYNALHVAAKAGRAAAAQLLLDTLADATFLAALYPSDSVDTRCQRIAFLTDLYLNTPDKGCNETPLHFACKYGFVDVVTVLLSQPAINRDALNKFGERPSDVNCSRARGTHASEEARIRALLEGVYFVPLLRAEDNTLPPVVGEPWSPTSTTPPLSPLPADTVTENSTDLIMTAYAGPMSPSQAKEFRKKCAHRKVKDRTDLSARLDCDKGLEAIGRSLASEMQVPWHESWDFLDRQVDLRTDEGLRALETYLARRRTASPLGDGHAGGSSELVCPHPSSGTAKAVEASLVASPNEIAGTSPRAACESPRMASLTEHFRHLTLVSPTAVADKLDSTAVATNSEQMPLSLGAAGLTNDELVTTDSIQAVDLLLGATVTDPSTIGGALPVSPRPNRSTLEYILPVLSPALSLFRRAMSYLPFVNRRSAVRPSALPNVSYFDSELHCPEPLIAHEHAIFIHGQEPTKIDCDVLRAVGNISIDQERYPNVVAWQQSVLCHSPAARDNWRSPAGVQRQRHTSRIRPPLLVLRQAEDSLRQSLEKSF